MHPFRVVRVARLEEGADEPGWLVGTPWSDQAVGFIAGTPKSCKTWLALELAVASGRPCLGRFPVSTPGLVPLVAAEERPACIRRGVAGIARARGVDLARLGLGLVDAARLRLDQLDIVHQDRDGTTLRRWSLSRAWPVKLTSAFGLVALTALRPAALDFVQFESSPATGTTRATTTSSSR